VRKRFRSFIYPFCFVVLFAAIVFRSHITTVQRSVNRR
jgi:general stress protein CsbA